MAEGDLEFSSTAPAEDRRVCPGIQLRLTAGLLEDVSDSQNEFLSRHTKDVKVFSYYSTNKAADGAFRKPSIQPGESNLRVRAKSGYYAAAVQP